MIFARVDFDGEGEASFQVATKTGAKRKATQLQKDNYPLCLGVVIYFDDGTSTRCWRMSHSEPFSPWGRVQ